MITLKISAEGSIIIPASIHHWQSGQELVIEQTDLGLLLKANTTTLIPHSVTEVAGCLKYEGKPKTLAEMEDGIRQGILEQWHDSD